MASVSGTSDPEAARPGRTGRVSPAEVAEGLRRGERIVVIDVRGRDAWTGEPSRIPGSIWLPLEEIPRRARGLPSDAHLVVYCS
jgi:rhodanese-related sulfurtransferase